MIQESFCARRLARLALTAAIVGTSFSAALRADTTATYTGPATGSWNNVANWTNNPAGAFIPSNGNGGVNYLVVIDGTATQNSTVNLVGIFTIDGLSITAGDILNIANNSQLVINSGPGIGNIVNDGTLNLATGGNPSDLVLVGGGTVSLSGSGIMTSTDNPNNRIYANSSLMTLVNSSVIQMAGQIDNGVNQALALNNSGTITAAGANPFIVAPRAGLTNTGLLQGGNGTITGSLQLLNVSVNNAGGTILANASSSVILTNAAIDGGTLTTNANGSIQTTGANFGSSFSNSVTISSGSTLTLTNNSGFFLNSGLTLTNNGTIKFNSAGNDTHFDLVGNAGTVTLAGTGVISWSDQANNRIIAEGSGMTLVNTTTIQGAGYFDNAANLPYAMINQSTITALGGSGLILATRNGLTNNGLLQGGNGTLTGSLQLTNISINNSSGTIVANLSSNVLLTNAAIAGGTLTTNANGSIQTAGANFGSSFSNSVTISPNSTLTLTNNSGILLNSGLTLTNSGTIKFNSVGNDTHFSLVGNAGTVTLAGSGVITWSDNGNNNIVAQATGMTLVNTTAIQGAGFFDNGAALAYALINQGTITALGGNALTLALRNGLTNNGLLQAGDGTTPGTLSIRNTSVLNNTTILANASSTVVLETAAISGGTLTTSANGVIQPAGANFGSSFSNSVTISPNSTLTLPTNTGFVLNSGLTLINSGSIKFNSAGNNTQFDLVGLNGTVTLAGSGVITWSDNVNNRIVAEGSSMTLVNATTIQGAGYFDNGANLPFAMINQGTISAVGGNALIIATRNGLTNNGILQAGNGVTAGNLNLLTSPILNTGGTITANTGSTIFLVNGLNIVGGLLSTSSNGLIRTADGNFGPQLTGPIILTAGSKLTVANNSGINLPGGTTFINNGSVNFASVGNNTQFDLLGLNGTVTLAGSGVISWSDNVSNRIVADGSSMTLVNATTIQGAGYFDNGASLPFAMINQGTITAVGANSLVIATRNGFTNNGLLQAGNGVSSGVLNLLTSPILNTGGTITANAGSVIFLSNGLNIVGGVIATTGTGLIRTADGNFAPQLTGPITLAAGSQFNVVNNSGILLPGGTTFTNNGSVNFLSVGNITQFDLVGNSGTVTLAGSGVINWSDNGANRIVADATGMTLLNTLTIQGAGFFDFNAGLPYALINQGTITALGGNSLTLATRNGLTNSGLLRAGNGVTPGVLNLITSPILNSGGTITANTGSTIFLNNGLNIVGGVISSTGTGFLRTADGHFAPQLSGNITFAAGSQLNVVNNSGINLAPSTVLTNNGSISLLSTGNPSQINLLGPGTFTINGSGSVTLGNGPNNRIIAGATGSTLDNAGSHTIAGVGFFGNGAGFNFTLTNEGTLLANLPGTLLVAPGLSTSNTGTLKATNGGTLQVTGILLQDTAGTLTAGTYVAEASSTVVLTNSPAVATIGAAATVELNGNASVFRASTTAIETSLAQIDGTLKILANRNFTTSNNIVSNGTLQLGGGVFTSPNYTNNASGLITGFGTITPRILNHGTIIANGGTLAFANGINGGSGTIQSDTGATLDLSAGTADSNGDLLVLQTGSSLVLGAHNVLVKVGYSNGDFGGGNSFNKHADISTTGGLILADGSNVQMLTGNVSGGGSATPTMDFGNIHVGSTASFAYTVNNLGSGTASGPAVVYAIETGVNGGHLTDSRLTGSGALAQTLSPVVFGGSSAALPLLFSGVTSGSLTAQSIHIANNFDGNTSGTASLVEQTLAITGAAWNYASAQTNTTLIQLGNHHVGDVPVTQHYVISNTAPTDGFSEKLDGTVSGNVGNATISGAFNLLNAGATDSSSIGVSYSSANAGTLTASANLGLTSDGQAPATPGNSGLGQTSLGSITLQAVGGIYRLANPLVVTNPVQFGTNHHVGDVVTQNISITNNVPNDGFSEKLDGTLSNLSGVNGFAGGFSLLAPTASSTIVATLDTSSVGSKSGSASLTLVSNGSGSSGLGLTPLSTPTLTSSGTVFRLAAAQTSAIPMPLANHHVGDVVTTQHFSVTNSAATDGFSEKLDGAVSGNAGNVSIGGSFSLLNAGATDSTSIAVNYSTASAGALNGTANLVLQSDGQALNTPGNSGLGLTNIGTVTLQAVGGVYRLANPLVSGATSYFGGNYHVGDVVTQNIIVTNNAINDPFSEKLDGSLSGATGTNTFTGSISLVNPQSSQIITATLDTSSPGTKTGAATLSLISNGSGTSGLGTTPITTVLLSSTGNVYSLAGAQVNGNPVNFGGNHHVGDVVTQNILVNNTDATNNFSEKLDGVISSPIGPNTFASFVSLVAPQTAGTVLATLDTSSAGSKSGSATLTLISNGSGTSGLGTTPISTVALGSAGAVYRLATAAAIPNINLGVLHVGSTGSATITISNTAAADGFSENLKASFTGQSGFATTSGGPVTVAAGSSNTNTMTITLDTASAQLNRSGNAFIHFDSDGTGSSGLGLTPLTPDQTVQISANVYNYASASMQKDSGNGAFTLLNSTSATLDFGTILAGNNVAASLSALNIATGPADTLSGNWTVNAAGFGTSNFVSFSNILGNGGAFSGLGISFSSLTPGLHTGTITLHDTSVDVNAVSAPRSDFTLNLSANVTAAVPEPATATLLLAATVPMLLRRRKRVARAFQPVEQRHIFGDTVPR